MDHLPPADRLWIEILNRSAHPGAGIIDSDRKRGSRCVDLFKEVFHIAAVARVAGHADCASLGRQISKIGNIASGKYNLMSPRSEFAGQ